MMFRSFFLLLFVPIFTIDCLTSAQREQQCAQDISPKIFTETDTVLKFALYRALVAQMAVQNIEMERIMRSLDRKRQQRVYDYYLTGPCESYKAMITAHENTTLPTPIRNSATSLPIVGVKNIV